MHRQRANRPPRFPKCMQTTPTLESKSKSIPCIQPPCRRCGTYIYISNSVPQSTLLLLRLMTHGYTQNMKMQPTPKILAKCIVCANHQNPRPLSHGRLDFSLRKLNLFPTPLVLPFAPPALTASPISVVGTCNRDLASSLTLPLIVASAALSS